MSNLSCSNIQNVKRQEVNFKGKNKYQADNIISTDEDKKSSVKRMVGSTLLAGVVAAGIILSSKGKLSNLKSLKSILDPAEAKIAKNISQATRKTPFEMSKTELCEWGEQTAKKLKKLAGKKRDMSTWKNVDKEGIVRCDSFMLVGGKNGKAKRIKLKKEIIYTKDKRLVKEYDLKGNLVHAFYTSHSTNTSHTLRCFPKGEVSYDVTRSIPRENRSVVVSLTGANKGNKNLDYELREIVQPMDSFGQYVELGASNKVLSEGKITV